VITLINDRKIESSRDLTLTIAAASVGETVNVKLIRDGKEKMLKVKLGKRPDENPESIEANDGYDLFGFRLKQMDADMARKLNYPEDIKGLVVIETDSGSQADKTPVRQGDLLMEVNRHKITSAQDYEEVLNKISKGKQVQLLFRRGNSHIFVVSFEKP
jgi:serine protease Do